MSSHPDESVAHQAAAESPQVIDADVGPDAASVDDSPSDDFSPVLSKSARRRQSRKLGALIRAEQAHAQAQAHPLPRTPMRYAPPPTHQSGGSFRTPPSASHMVVHQTPVHRVGGTANAVRGLKEMFPHCDVDVLDTLFQSLGSFDAVVEYMLTSAAAEDREEQQLKAALNNSLINSSSPPQSTISDSLSNSPTILSNSPSLSQFPPLSILIIGRDMFSSLSTDLFDPICEYLDLFDLGVLCRVSREIRKQVEQLFNTIDSLDFSKSRYQTWSDIRMLTMMSRFPGLHAINLKNCWQFHSFAQLNEHVFGRHIQVLSVAYCAELLDSHLSELFGLEHLRSLDCSGCEITDEGMENIATARLNNSLTKLSFADCKYISSHGILRVLEKCVSLQSLDLKGTNATKAILGFSGYSNLTYLNLSQCKKLHENFSITSKFCVLTSLNLSSNLNLKEITLSIPTLRQLNLSHSKQIHTVTLYTPALEKLNMSSCSLISKIVPYLPQNSTFVSRIEEINANGCRSITGMSFHHLLKSAQMTIKQLSCRGCLLLTDANLALLIHDELPSSNDPHSNNSNPSSLNLARSQQKGAQLFSIDLSGCKAANPQAIIALTRQAETTKLALEEAAEFHRSRNMYESPEYADDVNATSSSSSSYTPFKPKMPKKQGEKSHCERPHSHDQGRSSTSRELEPYENHSSGSGSDESPDNEIEPLDV